MARALAELAASGALAALPGVEGLTLTRARIVPTPHGDVAIRAVQPGARGWGLALVAGDDVAALDALADGTGVVASERLLFASELRVGDELELPAPDGRAAAADRRPRFAISTPACRRS